MNPLNPGTKFQKNLFLNDLTVMYHEYTLSDSDTPKNEILVNEDFMLQHNDDAGIWALIFLTLNEIGK